jgi:hypothetical protein
MDNFIQYLFYFIIIAAFLNSIFGKKKKVETRRVPQQQEPDSFGSDTIESRTSNTGNTDEDYTILNEIENLFKKEMPVEPTPVVKVEEAKIVEPISNMSYIEERAKEFEKQVNKRKDDSDMFRMNIRNKLQNPESLKDYIIISEILGKPKAFE